MLMEPPPRDPIPVELRPLVERANGNLAALKQAQAEGADMAAWYCDRFAAASKVYLIYRVDEGCGLEYMLADGWNIAGHGAVEALILGSKHQATVLAKTLGEGEGSDQPS